jgi:hypothetical protein
MKGLALLLLVAGCSSPAVAVTTAKATACREKGMAIIASADTCAEANANLAKLAARDVDCRVFFDREGWTYPCTVGGPR